MCFLDGFCGITGSYRDWFCLMVRITCPIKYNKYDHWHPKAQAISYLPLSGMTIDSAVDLTRTLGDEWIFAWFFPSIGKAQASVSGWLHPPWKVGGVSLFTCIIIHHVHNNHASPVQQYVVAKRCTRPRSPRRHAWPAIFTDDWLSGLLLDELLRLR